VFPREESREEKVQYIFKETLEWKREDEVTWKRGDIEKRIESMEESGRGDMKKRRG
jgi:hypothetical protein